MLPKVSCLCPTYGRVRALEEAIHSFLIQDYQGPKELVVLNDLDRQELVFNHPDVRIINRAERITPLAAKFNATARLATGEIFLVWEDDDIYLPHRISYTVNHLEKGLFHTPKGYHEEAPKKIVRSRNLFHANLGIERSLFWADGGYPPSDWCGVDTMLFQNLISRHGNFSKEISDADVFYIYRWGTINDYHASYWANNNASAMAADHVRGRILRGEIPTGIVPLVPHWSYNYTEYLP